MKEPVKVTQVRIPASVYAKARMEAARRQVSFNALVVEVLDEASRKGEDADERVNKKREC